MNFNEITNVSDLVKANEAPNPKEQIHQMITDQVAEVGPAVALEIATEIVQKLINLHEAVADERQEAGDIDGTVTWAQDQRSLVMARLILESIEL